MPSHRDRHIMEPGRVLRDLQGRAPIPHRMVRGHAALVLHTQAPGAGRVDPRDAGGARLRRPPPPSSGSVAIAAHRAPANRSGLTSCRTRARVLVALLEGPPSPGQISGYKNRTDDVLSTEPLGCIDIAGYIRFAVGL